MFGFLKNKVVATTVVSVLLIQSAGATVVVTGDNPVDGEPDLVVGNNVLSITGNFDTNETINFSQEFIAGPIAGGADVDVGIINSDGSPAGFDNLLVSFASSAGNFSFQLTEDAVMGAGAQILDFLSVALTPGEAFTVSIIGDAINPGTSTAFFSLNFSATEALPAEVPLPGAAWLLLSGMAGLGFAKRKSQAV